jgi:hypothetical protein
MAVYATTEQFYATMRALFDRLSAEPDDVALFQGSGLVIHIRLTDPPAEMTLNGRRNPVGVTFGPAFGRTDLELALPADVLHRVWLGQLRLRDAIAQGDLQVRGSIWKALQLAPLFRRAEALYPEVLQAQGIETDKCHGKASFTTRGR